MGDLVPGIFRDPVPEHGKYPFRDLVPETRPWKGFFLKIITSWSLLDWQGLSPRFCRSHQTSEIPSSIETSDHRSIREQSSIKRVTVQSSPITPDYRSNVRIAGIQIRNEDEFLLSSSPASTRPKKKHFCAKIPTFEKNPNPYISQHNSETNLHNCQAQVQVHDR